MNISQEDIIAAALLLADAVLSYHHDDGEEEKTEFIYDHMIESAVDLINMVLTKHYTENRGDNRTPPQVLYLLSRSSKTNKQTH